MYHVTLFCTYVKTQFNCQIKTVQTDGGGEFQPLSSVFTKLDTVQLAHTLTIKMVQ